MKQQYLAIKNRLVDQVTVLEQVDWYLQQEKQKGDTHVVITPAAFVEIRPIKWSNQADNVQRADINFRVHLISQTAYGDEQDYIEDALINHHGLEIAIHQALEGYWLAIDGDMILDNVTRIAQTIHTTPSNLVHTYQEFTAVALNYDAVPPTQEVEVSLDMEVCLTADVNIVTEVEAQ